MAISDFVLLHNKAAEGLAKHDRVGYDIYSGIADTKALFIKYCKQFEKRIHSMVPTHRVVPAGDGEDPTSVSIPGFLVDPKAAKTKKTFAPIKVEMQFLENHKKLYLELHRDFSKIDAALTAGKPLSTPPTPRLPPRTLPPSIRGVLKPCPTWMTTQPGHRIHGAKWITTRSRSPLTPCRASVQFGPTWRWQ